MDTKDQDAPVNRHVVAQNPTACESCWRRKLKCSGETTGCANCVKRNAVCDYNPALRSSRPRRNKPVVYSEDDELEWKTRKRRVKSRKPKDKRKRSESPPSSENEQPQITQPVAMVAMEPAQTWQQNPYGFNANPYFNGGMVQTPNFYGGYQPNAFYGPGQYFYNPNGVMMPPAVQQQMPSVMQMTMSQSSIHSPSMHSSPSIQTPMLSSQILSQPARTNHKIRENGKSLGLEQPNPSFSTDDHGAGFMALVKNTEKAGTPKTTPQPSQTSEFWRCRLPHPLCNTPEAPEERLCSVGLKRGTQTSVISVTNLVRSPHLKTQLHTNKLFPSNSVSPSAPSPKLNEKDKFNQLRAALQTSLREPTLADQRYFIHLFWWYQPHAVPYAHPEIIPWREDWTLKTSWGLASMAHGVHHADPRVWSRDTKSFLIVHFVKLAKAAFLMELNFAIDQGAQPRLETLVGVLKLLELVGDYGHGKTGEKLIHLCRMMQLRWRFDDFDMPMRQEVHCANPYPAAPAYARHHHVEAEMRLRCWWAMAGLDRAAASIMQRAHVWWPEVQGKRLPCSDRIWGILDIALMDRELFMAFTNRFTYQSWVDLSPGLERQTWMSRVISTLCDESTWAFSLLVTDLNLKSRELVDWIRANGLDPIYEPGPLGNMLQRKRDELELAYYDFWRMMPQPLAHLDQVGDGDGMIRYALMLEVPHQYAISLPFSLVSLHLAFMVAFLPPTLGMFQSDRFLLSPRFSQISERAIMITRLVVGAKQSNANFDLIPGYATYGLMTSGCVHLAALRKLKMMPECETEILVGLESDVSACLDALRLLARASSHCHKTYMVYKSMVEAQGYDVQVEHEDVFDEMDALDARNGWTRQQDVEVIDALDIELESLQRLAS